MGEWRYRPGPLDIVLAEPSHIGIGSAHFTPVFGMNPILGRNVALYCRDNYRINFHWGQLKANAYVERKSKEISIGGNIFTEFYII